MLTAIGFVVMGWWVFTLQRQIEEQDAALTRLHKDFMDEIYIRYGEALDGKK